MGKKPRIVSKVRRRYLYARQLVTLWSNMTRKRVLVTLSVPERGNKAARCVMIAVLVFLVAIPVGATAALATSHGQNGSKLVSNCLALRSSEATVIAGGSGLMLFSCAGSAALTVGKSDQFRPIFTLPTGYTGLRIVNHALGATDCNQAPVLVSGRSFDLSGPGDFDYCAAYANAPSTGLASFKVAWSK